MRSALVESDEHRARTQVRTTAALDARTELSAALWPLFTRRGSSNHIRPAVTFAESRGVRAGPTRTRHDGRPTASSADRSTTRGLVSIPRATVQIPGSRCGAQFSPECPIIPHAGFEGRFTLRGPSGRTPGGPWLRVGDHLSSSRRGVADVVLADRVLVATRRTQLDAWVSRSPPTWPPAHRRERPAIP